jgi:hypothetical protein
VKDDHTNIHLGCIALALPRGWCNITDELKGDDAPYTLAKGEMGVGALQFFTALYQTGELPHVTISDLSGLLRDFAATKRLCDEYGRSTFEGQVMFVAASYRYENDFARVWYCSDGTNVALVTYTCASSDSSHEAIECEEILKTLRFVP